MLRRENAFFLQYLKQVHTALLRDRLSLLDLRRLRQRILEDDLFDVGVLIHEHHCAFQLPVAKSKEKPICPLAQSRAESVQPKPAFPRAANMLLRRDRIVGLCLKAMLGPRLRCTTPA